MESLKPMQPMRPMTPLGEQRRWWPEELGEPASSGAQNGVRYAIFPDAKPLLVERNGGIERYDTADRVPDGVRQAGPDGGPVFGARTGAVTLAALRRAD